MAGNSQRDYMGKFSIHDPIIEGQEGSPGSTTRTNGVATGVNDNPEMVGHLAADYTQLHAFNMDFFSNETNMINDYLMGSFTQLDYRTPMIEDAPNDFMLPDRTPLAPAESSTHEPPLIAQVNTTQIQDNATAILSGNIDLGNAINPLDGEPSGVDGSMSAIDDLVSSNTLAVSAFAHERLFMEVNKYKDVLPEAFHLPSRRTLSRYIASYIRSFHPHLPYIHLPTTNLDTMSPMLVLTLAAVGSFYGFEHTHGYSMYFIAKAMITSKLEERRRASTLHLLKTFPPYAELRSGSTRGISPATQMSAASQSVTSISVTVEVLQALIAIIQAMCWLDEPLAEEALAMTSQLSALARELLRLPPLASSASSWNDWAREEERRRTIFSAYFLLNIHTICFNIPPQITNFEMNLPLPSSEAEFKAPNANAWRRLQAKRNSNQPEFQHCFKQLLSGRPLQKEVLITEFGNYLLLQGLLMQIYFERQGALVQLSSSSGLAPATIRVYDTALSAWQSCWDSAIESALDPSSPHGPLAFNSAAMLRLAHIHLGAGIYHLSALRCRDPRVVSQAFEPRNNPISLRSTHMDKAVLHAIYALRVPVRVGVALVARGRTGHWSVQHAISNFSCALLLTHWLESLYEIVSSDGMESLSREEKRLLSMIERLIEETHLEDSLGAKDHYPARIRRLAIAAVTLWAETCQGIQVYDIVHVVGETLALVVESLERRLDT